MAAQNTTGHRINRFRLFPIVYCRLVITYKKIFNAYASTLTGRSRSAHALLPAVQQLLHVLSWR